MYAKVKAVFLNFVFLGNIGLFISLFFVTFNLLAFQRNAVENKDYNSFYSNGEYEKALELALDSLQKFPVEEISNEKAEVLKDVGNMYSDLGDYLKASEYLKQAVEMLGEFPAADLNLLAFCHNNLAYAYDWAGYSNQCIYHYEKAYELWSNNYADDYWNMVTIFNNLRDAFIQYGDLKRGQFYMDKFADYAEYAKENLIDDRMDLLEFEVRFLFIQVTFLSAIPEEVAATKRWDEMKLLYPAVKKNKLNRLDSYFLASLENIGFMYKTMGKYERALSYYDQMASYGARDFFEMKMEANKSIVYYDNKQWNASLLHCNKALKYFENTKVGASELILTVIKAELLFRLGEIEESKKLVTEIFSIWTENTVEFSDLGLLDIKSLQGKNSLGYIDILIKSANIVYEMALFENNDAMTQMAFNLYILASHTFESFYLKGAYNPNLATKQGQISEGLLKILAIKPSLNNDGLYRGVNQIERNESQQYIKEFLSKNIQNLSGSFELINQKNEIVLAIRSLEGSGNNESPELIKYKLSLDSIEMIIQKESLKDYAGESLGFDLVRVQKLLRGNELILKYYLTPEKVFLLSLDENKVQLFDLGKRDEIQKEVFGLKGKLTDPRLDFLSEAKALYKKIIPIGLDIAEKKLVIIPHIELSYIPFEALVASDGRFLVETNSVSYAYSLQLFEYRAKKKSLFPREFLASYAPSYEGSGFSSIKNNQKEASRVSGIFGGNVFLNSEATKSAFISNMTQFKVHHLALHAEQEDFSFENSALVFSGEEKLFFHELYNLNFPADLVVLSACNTGVGSLEPGVGLMGLGRALTYAGVGASVYSLWPISDKETSILMEYFYTYLKFGHPKDEALRMAKLDFINQNSLKTHPYFWAGFVLNGDTSEVMETPISYNLYLLIILILSLMVTVFCLSRRRKSGDLHK